MTYGTYCPGCGVNTVVELSSGESREYAIHGDLPSDFDNRAICQCCLDDGFVIARRCTEVISERLRRFA